MNNRLFNQLLLVFITVAVFVALGLELHAVKRPEGLYAHMNTTKGKISFRLFYKKAPMTVANFVSLVEFGTNPITGDGNSRPFYDGLTFHRIIPGIMVQGGDPKGNGFGGPGYEFEHEFHPDLRHDRPGILSMLNKGLNSSGSLFFITLKATPIFNNKHAVFGRIVEGQVVAERLEKGDRIIHITIDREGEKANAFDLSHYLEQVRFSARQIEIASDTYAEMKLKDVIKDRKKQDLPVLTGEIDPNKVPDKGQPEIDNVALSYLLVTYKGAVAAPGMPIYDRGEAKKVTRLLSEYAREKGVDFQTVIKEFSDSPDSSIPILKKTTMNKKKYSPVFRLLPGQISDPIETPRGFMLFKREKLILIKIRHILITFKGADKSNQTRTREQALNLANNIRKQAVAGENFAELARSYSDSISATDGGLIAEIARGQANPAFDIAAFSLNVNEVSEVTPTPAGFQIIKRIE